ncbi:4-hydroxyacetophenone monooxygenase [Tricladium varicosporioides]|nr:4-hydroxyacetophenone monooxygenase [Hymenoscyphus varicosporioides]
MAQRKSYSTVAIIGSGFGGIGIGCQLKRKLNFNDFIIFERSPMLGGTWRSNTYPGCGVDVPAVLYSLSFAPNPNFSRLFPDQSEILLYLEKVTEDFGISPHIQYETLWESAHWEEKTKTWILKMKDAQNETTFEHECKILISAIGRLVIPNSFKIEGQDEFSGEIVHSAEWRSDIDLKNKEVVVIGNGCSGSQIVPAIVNQAKNVYHFMRTPQYYVPKPLDRWRFSNTLKWMFKYVPFLLVFLRTLMFVYLESSLKQFSLDVSAERQRRKVQAKSRKYIQKKAPSRYWKLLTPEYALGCKRKILDPGYIDCLHRSNVLLTNERITSLNRKGVVTESGKHYPANLIIVANGFRTFHYPMTVTGREKRTLSEHWSSFGGMEAYRSTAMTHFPNFFLLSGPNSVSGHSSSVFSIEHTINLILKVIKPVLKATASEVEVREEAEREWVERVQGALRERVYADNCDTYYVDQKTGWNFTNYPWSWYHFWWHSNFPNMRDWIFGT